MSNVTNTTNEVLNEQIFELLEATGLNWEVSKEALISGVDNAPTGSFGIFKKSSRQHLGTVAGMYSPMQNWELAENLLIAAEGVGVDVTRGGQLSEGRKVYLQAQLPTVHIGKSDMKRWLTALNSHDGSTSINFGSTNTVVVCQNTFYRASQDLSKFRHTASAAERVKAMAISMNKALKADEALVASFQKMAATPLTDDLAARVIAKIFRIKEGDKLADVSSRKRNQMNDFAVALNTEVELEGNTVWGLFNAVTRYTNHMVRKNDTAAEKLEYLMVGGGYQMSNMTYDILMAELGLTTQPAELVEA